MLPLSDGQVLLSSILVAVFIVAVGAIFAILCCFPKKSNKNAEDGRSKSQVTNGSDTRHTCKDDDESTPLLVNEVDKERIYKVYDAIPAPDKPLTEETPQDTEKDLDSTPGSQGHIDSVGSANVTGSSAIRQKNEEEDKEAADIFSQQHFSNSSFESLANIGSRLQKYWYQRSGIERSVLQITAKISLLCPFYLGDKEVVAFKELMECLQHPSLLPVYDMAYNSVFITLLVELVESGSLRDRIHSVKFPLDDWRKKYSTAATRSLPLPVKEISSCGRQVLEAVLLLYDYGLQSIGQIQSGNVFKIGGRYVLGGYENTFLGYRSSNFKKLQQAGLLKSIDVIMFGILIYEMSTGISEITNMPLDESDFENVNDSRVKGILQYIFGKDVKSAESQKQAILKILSHRFFRSEEKTTKTELFELSTEGYELISAVRAQQSGVSGERYRVTGLDVHSIQKKLPQTCTVITPWQQTGWRSKKAMAKAESSEFGCCLVTAIEIPHTCPVFVEPASNSILEILKLKHLLVTYDVHYMKVNQAHIMVLFQEYFEHGSLKDQLYKTSPLKPWHEKYEGERRTMSDDEIAIIGSQILNIAASLSYMDRKQTPLKLRLLHSGNIFMDGNHYVIGGVENMLLGCRPHHYVKFRDYLSCIDTVMFGHFVFELAAGRELSTVIPTNEDYCLLSGPIQNLLKTIFGNLEMDLKEISSLEFFESHYESCQVIPKSFKKHVKLLLEKIRKEKKRNQDDEAGKRKYKRQRL